MPLGIRNLVFFMPFYNIGLLSLKFVMNFYLKKSKTKERKLNASKREKERTAPIHAKHTHATRVSHLTAQTRRIVLQDDDENNSKTFDLSKDWTLETTKDHPFGKEGIVEYINRKREMFLVKGARVVLCLKSVS